MEAVSFLFPQIVREALLSRLTYLCWSMLAVLLLCSSCAERKKEKINIEKVQAEISDYRKRLKSYAKKTLKRNETNAFIRVFRSRAFACGGDIKSFAKGVVPSSSMFYHKLNVNTDLKIGFENMVKFLAWLENYEKTVFLRNISITPDKSGKHHVNLSLTVYVRYYSEQYFIEKLVFESSRGQPENLKKEDYLPLIRDLYRSRLIVSRKLMDTRWDWSERLDTLAFLPKTLSIRNLNIRDAATNPLVTIIMQFHGKTGAEELVADFFRKHKKLKEGLLPPDITREGKDSVRVGFTAY